MRGVLALPGHSQGSSNDAGSGLAACVQWVALAHVALQILTAFSRAAGLALQQTACGAAEDGVLLARLGPAAAALHALFADGALLIAVDLFLRPLRDADASTGAMEQQPCRLAAAAMALQVQAGLSQCIVLLSCAQDAGVADLGALSCTQASVGKLCECVWRLQQLSASMSGSADSAAELRLAEAQLCLFACGVRPAEFSAGGAAAIAADTMARELCAHAVQHCIAAVRLCAMLQSQTATNAPAASAAPEGSGLQSAAQFTQLTSLLPQLASLDSWLAIAALGTKASLQVDAAAQWQACCPAACTAAQLASVAAAQGLSEACAALQQPASSNDQLLDACFGAVAPALVRLFLLPAC